VRVGIQKESTGAPIDLEFQNKFVVSQKRLVFFYQDTGTGSRDVNETRWY